MRAFNKPIRAGILAALLAAISGFGLAAGITIPSGPLYVGAAVQPLVMLDITKDQNLYHKAYDDYSDLNGDGYIDTTYNHTIDYYGYFDSYKCYTYSGGVFSPVAASYSEDAITHVPNKPADCSSWTGWHGNFLNWVTMSRMDAVRKLLFGGYRSTDTASTVLERAYIPTDAHAWAKYYNSVVAKAMDLSTTDSAVLTSRYPSINKLTPFSPTENPAAITSSTSNSIGNGARDFAVSSTTAFSYGDQVWIEDAADSTNYMIGSVGCVNGTGITMYDSVASVSSCSSGHIKVLVSNFAGSGTKTSWKIYNWTQTGISFCNASPDVGSTNSSQTTTQPPLMRAAFGNFSLWSANERWQCIWREESTSPGESTGSLSGAVRTQGNMAGISGIYASSIGPNKTTSSSGRIANGVNGASSDYTVRVQACVTGAIGAERCAQYPGGNYKPIGLLQYYGESGQLKFGLMTGSYSKNKSGGVLRKNIGDISDEINKTTDGSFKTPAAGTVISTLNKMRMWGYYYGDGTYAKDSTGGSTFCSWGQNNFTEGQCLSWGNPMSEIYLESIRYLAGKSATSAFNVGSDMLGLVTATWNDPLSSTNYCAPLNVLAFNSAAPTYDRDQMGGASDIGTNAATMTNLLATQEGINGGNWFIGNNGSGGTPADLCSAKPVSALASAYGICPEAAKEEGSYLMSGLAYYAHTNRIRSDITVPADNVTALKVSTYGIALATNTPKVKINVGGNPVIFMPQERMYNGTDYGTGTLVDFKVVCQIPVGASSATVAAITKMSAGRCSSAGSGSFYVNMEDSQQGGDYDQDLWGRLTYQISGSNVTFTTDVVAQSTPYAIGFGYTLSGTTKDGPHFTSGINSFNYTDTTSPTVTGDLTHISGGACNGCVYSDGATSATFTTGGSGGGTLQDPLWYTAKYGGFHDLNSNGKPDGPEEWDVRNADGSTTGCTSSGCDGVPDNFFLVSNPNYLEDALDKVFIAMLSQSSASSVATNSTSLLSGSRIYQASFNANDWSGKLLALNLATADNIPLNIRIGDVLSPPAWDAGQVINSQTPSSRAIITYGRDTKDGIPFTWSAISGQTDTTQKDALNKNALAAVDGMGSQRVAYLRGDASNEGKSATNFRPRPTSKLGDVVYSSPIYIGAPTAGWAGSAYKNFRINNLNRTPIIFLGANDGMLHAFDAATGNEKLAYVPSVFYNSNTLLSNLSQLTGQNYSHKYYVDGTPMVNDIEVGSGASLAWKTVLAGGLNWGGRAYYALDVTDPDGAHTSSLAFSEANAANLVMWEFTNANDGDLGYTFSQPSFPPFKDTAQQIAKMRNGKWALIVGNGYNSDNGKAALFIFFLDRSGSTWTLGTDYIKIVADAGPNNGLATPLPFSARQDGVIDWIYAGDLKGNMWKFDVSSASPASWAKAFGGQPLFVAADASSNLQPITTAPMVMPHPSGGAMVLFGTGKYLETSDTTGPYKIQSFYGVWDGDPARTGAVPRSKLRQQKVAGTVARTAGSITNNYRITTDYCIGNGASTDTISGFDVANGNAATAVCSDNWGATATDPKYGWYMDMPNSDTTGERIAYNPLLRNNRIVFPTLIPSTVPCDVGGSSWLMELDALTGRRLITSPFDTNGDGKFDDQDLLPFGTKSVSAGGIMPGQGGIITTPTVVKDQTDPRKEYKYASSSKGAVIKTPENVDPNQSGRITWREIMY